MASSVSSKSTRPAKLIVQKFGGTSVGSAEKIKQVAARIASASSMGTKVVVVVSAMGDSTDELLELARGVSPKFNRHEREMDMLLSAGERVSMALLSMALRDQGIEAISFTGSQSGIITDGSHTRARILEIRPIRIREELEKGKVVIVAGFQGVSLSKEITTLGRGGSDTTAVALAATLGADRCEIYTDVAGIYSSDPRKVEAAKRYRELSLELVGEMAVRGAQVMHPRSIEIARERRFPIYVGLAHPQNRPEQTSREETGTMIEPREKSSGLETPKVVAVVSKTNLRRLRFNAQVDEVLQTLERDSVVVHDLEVSPAQGLTVAVDADEAAKFIEANKLHLDHNALALVSLVGFQLQQNARVPAKILATLKRAAIEPSGLTCHPQSITVWLSDRDPTRVAKIADEAVRCLHDALVTA